jgi:hypothetical protein
MPLETFVTCIANHVGLGSIKNVTGIRKDLTDTKKAKLEIEKLEKEVDPPLVQPATFQDVKDYDPKYARIREHIRISRPPGLQDNTLTKGLGILLTAIFLFLLFVDLVKWLLGKLF